MTKYPPKSTKEERLFCLTVPSHSPSDGYVTAAGTWNSWSHHILREEAARDKKPRVGLCEVTQLRLRSSVKCAQRSGLLQLRQNGLAVSNLFQPFFIRGDSTSISYDCLVFQVCSFYDVQLLVPKGHACPKVPSIVTLRVIFIFFRKENSFLELHGFLDTRDVPIKCNSQGKGICGKWASGSVRPLCFTSTARL